MDEYNLLMLAYMNEEAFQRTIHSGKMTYYSRSRQEIWMKGETSGHIQYVKSLSADCGIHIFPAHTKHSFTLFLLSYVKKWEDMLPLGKFLGHVFPGNAFFHHHNHKMVKIIAGMPAGKWMI